MSFFFRPQPDTFEPTTSLSASLIAFLSRLMVFPISFSAAHCWSLTRLAVLPPLRRRLHGTGADVRQPVRNVRGHVQLWHRVVGNDLPSEGASNSIFVAPNVLRKGGAGEVESPDFAHRYCSWSSLV